MIRILHTADWQIGKPFGGYAPDKRGELKAARFSAVERIAALARERCCDAVVVAGDAFDDNTVSDREIRRMVEATRGFAGPWIFLPGNHDAALTVSVWTRLREMIPDEHLLVACEPKPIRLLNGRLAVLPAPLTRRHEGADLTEWFDRAESPAGAVRLGLAHGSVANRLPEKAESGNPIAETRAARAGLDYLALGDWHGFVEIAPRTFYSGTPEPDRYPANQPGHAAIVEIDGPGAPPRVERVRIARFDWLALDLPVFADASELDAALERIARPGETLLDLRLSGSLPLRERVALEARLDDWRSRLFDLRVDEAALVDEPDEDDLDRIDLSGFVRVAVERLRAKATDPSDPEAAAAAMALRMAFVDHTRLGDPFENTASGDRRARDAADRPAIFPGGLKAAE